MSRIIVIADADYQIRFDNGVPVEAIPGGTLLNTAVQLSRMGHNVAMASEVGNDTVGELILGYLAENGVDTKSVDRSIDCITPATLIFGNGKEATTMRYTCADAETEGLDIVWPDLEPGDTIIFGGYMAVNQRCHRRLLQLLTYAADRRINIIYFPGFDPSRISRITKVMPMIFENLEIAQCVVTRTRDIEYIFGKTDPAKAFDDHLDFYTDKYVNIDSDGHALLFRIGAEPVSMTAAKGTDALMTAEIINKLIN